MIIWIKKATPRNVKLVWSDSLMLIIFQQFRKDACVISNEKTVTNETSL